MLLKQGKRCVAVRVVFPFPVAALSFKECGSQRLTSDTVLFGVLARHATRGFRFMK